MSCVIWLCSGRRSCVHLHPRVQHRRAWEEFIQVDSILDIVHQEKLGQKGKFKDFLPFKAVVMNPLWTVFTQDHVQGDGPTRGEGSGPQSLWWAACLRRRANRLCASTQEQEGGGLLLDPDGSGLMATVPERSGHSEALQRSRSGV